MRGTAVLRASSVISAPLCLIVLILSSVSVSAKALDIYFIDVEGGAATLIVTPLGESILIDSGFPGERDAGRIARVARDVAKLTQIDHYITTHWHRDHVGGIPQLVQLIPVKRYYDHGIQATLAQDILPELIDPYKKTTDGKNETLKAGEEIKLRNDRSVPRLRLEIVAGSGVVKGEPAGSPQIRVCNPDQKPAAEDETDNANSLGFVLSFGGFRFFDGGDLTWNVENKLVCPRAVVGMVDVYQVDHHGSDRSNNPTLINNLQPRVAIIDNGPRKGGEVNTFATLKASPGIEAIYQLHRNLATTANDNTMSGYIANEEENCKGDYIRLSVDEAARSYTVSIDAKQISRKYRVGRVGQKN